MNAALGLLTSLHHEVFGSSAAMMALTTVASITALMAVVLWAARSDPGRR